jgi:hypothetical protein
VSDSDITHGLPRVVELFEARTPKGAAKVAEHNGIVHVELIGRERKLTIVSDEGEIQEESIPIARHLLVEDGQEVEVGTPLHDGPLDPKVMMKYRGTRETQQYLVEEVQNVYRDQGVSIHDKHIELIVRQMTSRVQIVSPGDSPWLPGEVVASRVYRDFNAVAMDALSPIEQAAQMALNEAAAKIREVVKAKEKEISKFKDDFASVTQTLVNAVETLEGIKVQIEALTDESAIIAADSISTSQVAEVNA